jgi:hypothetical protein|tara:strand:+ start:75 stop:374 length:300 start_codon:yes stop_codon:yes gene_type:complete
VDIVGAVAVKYIKQEPRHNAKVKQLDQNLSRAVDSYLKRWSNLNNEDRARLVCPIIQMVAQNTKPWKAGWDLIDTDEMELLINTMIEARQMKLGLFKQK